MTTPYSPTRLIVLRGNSASGKSSVATGLRERYGRGIALVRQDTLRREVLRERDIPGGANIGLIDLTVRHALAHGFHTVLEGLLYVSHYGEMPAGLLADHPGRTHCYYLDVPFEETLARHATKPIADEVTERQLREWYRPLDVLPGGVETVVPATSPLAATVERVLRESGLADVPRSTVG
ncbi:kinase [Streptomyces sp. MBT65]|uniref:kinase n=1 Tax=Streptomyces sp. MBT65 TaxID=1488395 RepID=UPI00190B2142|nr:kinase [Streptomyces sp. MBT65]MBK3576996.1 kinase [Streptomyces sp. MBT65]